MTNISRTELCKWLRDNSSGIYRHAADAADEIEMLAQLANQHFERAMENGNEVLRLREENERLRKDAEVDVDWLSNVIRSADGNHSLGAGALAEKIVEAIDAARGAK